jgi:Na+/proline symporter
VAVVKDVTGDQSYNDINYVFPTWVTTQLPIGLIGLILAAIFAAAMSTISAELAALSTATVIDLYKRRVRPEAEDRHYLQVSRLATGFWGLFASAVAVWSVELGSLIEVVNRFGSFFYGSILGVFLLAIGWRRATGNGAFVGLIAGMAAVAAVNAYTNIEFLWHNIVGAVTVFVVGMLVSAVDPRRRPA